MKKHPVIIEFCGVPGCGKSTLCKTLTKDVDLNIGGIEDLLIAYNKLTLYKKIVSFPYAKFLKLLSSFLAFPLLKWRDFYLYVDFVKILILYNTIEQIQKHEYIVIDGGIVQSFVGLFFQREEHFSQKTLERVLAFMNYYPEVHVCVCRIPIEETIKRIRIRNRKYGRFDVIADDKILNMKLTKQSLLFDILYKEMHKNSNVVTLSMMKSEESLVSDFQSFLIRF